MVAFLAAANVFVLVYSGYTLQQSREHHEQQARLFTQNLSQAVDYSLSNSIEKIDLALKTVADELQQEMARGGVDARKINGMLERFQKRLPEVEGLRVSDAEGTVILGTGVDPQQKASWADREYFPLLRDDANAGLHVSPPRIGKVAKKPIIGFERRYSRPDGSFGGIVAAPVSLEHFNTLLSQFDIHGKSLLVLRDLNLGLIARYSLATSQANAIGSATVSEKLRELVRSGAQAATYDAVLPVDGREWTLTFRRIKSAPMIIVVGSAKEDYLADWRDEVLKAALIAGGFLLLSLLSGWLVLHLQARMARESARNRLYLHHASDGIQILDDQGNLLQASDEFCAMLGYGRDEVIGMNIARWEAGWSEATLRDEVFPGWLRLDAATAFETYHRCKDGTLIDVEVNVAGFEMDGKRCLFASSRDIGDKKRQQQALISSEVQLRQSEERYRLLLQNSPVGILHYDANLVVTYANDRFAEIMHVPPGYMVGLDCSKLEDQSVVAPMRQALAGQTTHYEGPYVTTYGHTRLSISQNCAPIMTPKGEILGGIVILEDATERKRIEENERRQREGLARLNEVAAFSHLPLAEQLQRALAIGNAHLGLEFGIVSHVCGQDYKVVAHVSPPCTIEDGQVFLVANTYCQITLEHEECVAIADMGHSSFRRHPCYQNFQLEAYIGAPVQVGGRIFGTVNFSSPKPYHRDFDDGDREFVSLLARWVGSAIERDQAESQLRLAASVFAHAHEGIMICDAGRKILDVNPTFTEITGYGRDEVLGQTPLILNSGRQDAEFYRMMWATIQEQGHWHGEVWNRRKDGASYAERLTISSVTDDKGQVTRYIGTFSDISLLKRHQAELERLAHYDALTHLPNRALLSDRMTQALAQSKRNGAAVAVCYLDLDGFKAINDELGHDAGDILLIEVGQRLADTVRAGDTVARLGGDEFAILLIDVANRDECERAAIRILRAIAAPVHIKGQERTVSGSLGITLFPDDGADPDTLLRHADQTMYLAKQAGKNRYLLFDSSSSLRARDRQEAIARLQLAVERGELRLHYQPVVDMSQGKVLGFEGLIRWQHPERGLLLPADFLPSTEGTELEEELGRWVLATGLHQLSEWRREGILQRLSLNISSGHLLSPGFADELAAFLASHPDLETRALELEILESAAMTDLEAAIAVFRRCHDMGVDIALDDFGTGHSSLACFRRLPVDTLKVDQVFVQSVLGDSEDLAIVESVVALTRAFNRKLVAEGVESVEIGMLLLHLGCSVGQGYGIARPMPADEVPGWLASFAPNPNWSLPVSRIPREDIPLFMAELEHRAWIRRMGDWLRDEQGNAALPPQDIHQCRFGKWYDGPGKKRLAQFDSFRTVGNLHDAIHGLAHQMVDLCGEGRRDEASQCYEEMTRQRDLLVEQLASLQAEVILEGM
ncbi:MAG TPA: EAL domain-containing protein [Rhodocyclaceae bacterium]|nr:EAL domain-containing protein [Rhodocyclaceae bacterium]